MRLHTRATCLILPLVALALASSAFGQAAGGKLLDNVGFDQNLDAQLPLDLKFRDETGKTVALGDYFGKRPVILTLVYYRCPLLCGQALNGLARSLKPLSLVPGKDFDLVTVSIDPEETPDVASAKKVAYLKKYGKAGGQEGWHFLTGDEASIKKLASTVGFRYTFNPRTKLYAHAAGLIVATPGGKIGRYFYGIDFPAKDLQFGVLEASAGRIGTPIARLLLFCYDYDAASGKYTLAIMRLIRVLGTSTVVALGSFLFFMIRREHKRSAIAALGTRPPHDLGGGREAPAVSA